MSLEVLELSPVGGAEVRGIALDGPPEALDPGGLNRALDRYGFLVVRGQHLTAPQLAAFSRVFGAIQPHVQRAYQHPEVPEVVVMTNRRADGSFDEAGARRGAVENVRDGWHSDLSYDPVPAKATLLHALEIPSRGGNTCFCNSTLAYESLSDGDRAELDGALAEFVYGGHRRNPGTSLAASALDAEATASAHAVHPVIGAHPVTGRPGIYANPLITTRILDWPPERSEAMLNRLFDALDDPAFRYEHQWRLGDTLIWDNRGGWMHAGRLDYPRDEPRRMIRTTVSGAAIEAYRREPGTPG
jgi:taurine dioxygenase